MKDLKMEIELFKDPHSKMYIPLVNGVLQDNFFEFMEYRCHFAAEVNINWRNLSPSSIRSHAYTIKRHLEILHDEGWHISEIDYQHVIKSLDEQFEKSNWDHKYYNSKLTQLSEFYEFLTWKGVKHNVDFPREVGKSYVRPNDFNFLSHVYRSSQVVTKLRDIKKYGYTEDYLDSVISMDQFNELCLKLNEIDPVYAVMAMTMLQTCLRTSNLCQLPFSADPLNPDWLIWPEFKLSHKNHLMFYYIAKGNQPRKCYVWPNTIHTIYERYIKSHYRERKRMFEAKYLNRNNAKLSEGEVRLPDKILWLNQYGSPVKPYMLQKAFRDADMRIHPHCLRHTGATHLLYNYCKIMGIEPTEQLATQFHTVLQFQLGHKSIETTLYYIRTIMSRQAQLIIPFALPGNKLELDQKLSPELSILADMDSFFKGTSNIIDQQFNGLKG